MEKKEAYRNRLPHFQQPGQAYFVTYCLKDSVPPKALVRYTQQLDNLKREIEKCKVGCGDPGAAIFNRRNNNAITNRVTQLKQQYYLVRKQYIKAYDDLLDVQQNPTVNLSNPVNLTILIETLKFWENKKINNIVFSIMPNHVHWVFELLKADIEGKPVYLQDILQSVKRQSSRQINLSENRTGALWQKESFETTIRDEKHLYYAIRYTLNNPVNAGLVTDWKNWQGSQYFDNHSGCGDFQSP
jgi:putative transposase